MNETMRLVKLCEDFSRNALESKNYNESIVLDYAALELERQCKHIRTMRQLVFLLLAVIVVSGLARAFGWT